MNTVVSRIGQGISWSAERLTASQGKLRLTKERIVRVLVPADFEMYCSGS